MFGLSFTKLVVLGLAIFGAWQLFRWIERRGSHLPPVSPPAPPAEPNLRAEDKAMDMEQDPRTGVWRPKDRE